MRRCTRLTPPYLHLGNTTQFFTIRTLNHNIKMAVLTAERLVKLAYKYPTLHSNWYIIASTALAVVNQPQEIGKVLHFALRQQLLESLNPQDKPLLTDPYLLKLAEDSISSAAKFDEFTAVGVNLPDILIPYTYHDKLPLPYKYSRTEDITAAQIQVAARIREALLKIAPIAGLPKSINALTALHKVTPSVVRAANKAMRPPVIQPGHVNSSSIVQEDVAGTRFEDQLIDTRDTIDGPICKRSVDSQQVSDNFVRGSAFWESIYGKVSNRVKNQMFSAYPDLWQYAINNVYSPILSFVDILPAKETSLCVVAALIPQDVPPTLKGHVRGAINVGASKDELSNLRLLVFDVCDWSGNVMWKGGKESVYKL